MAIIDETFIIRQGLHRIKTDEVSVATGAELDRIGREYSIGRTQGEFDDDYRHRVWMRIMKVMNDAAAAEIERKREESGESDDLVVFFVSSERARAAAG